jgi:FtsH-binding integral membrane protein
MKGKGQGGRAPSPWYLLLLVPFVAMMWVSSYDRAAPSWGGVPFFYWYQLLWILIGAALTLIVYLATGE